MKTSEETEIVVVENQQLAVVVVGLVAEAVVEDEEQLSELEEASSFAVVEAAAEAGFVAEQRLEIGVVVFWMESFEAVFVAVDFVLLVLDNVD